MGHVSYNAVATETSMNCVDHAYMAVQNELTTQRSIARLNVRDRITFHTSPLKSILWKTISRISA